MYSKLCLNNYTIVQFINANSYLGFQKQFSIQTCFEYLFGVKNNIYIINLLQTIYSLKIVYNFLALMLKYYGSIWIVDLWKYTQYILTDDIKLLFFYNKYRIFIWDQIWESGLVSNYIGVRKCPKIKWPLFFWYPSTLFFFSSLIKPKSILETQSMKLALPVLSIMDTCTNLPNENYRIPGNEKNNKSLIFFILILIKFLYKNLLLKDLLFINLIFKKK